MSGGSRSTSIVDSKSDDSECNYDALHHGLDPRSTSNVSNIFPLPIITKDEICTQWKATVEPSLSQVLPEQDITAQLPNSRASQTTKLVHGKAVEPENIPPPPSLAMRKDFIWVTVGNVISALFYLTFCSRLLLCYTRSQPLQS